ncbi:SCA7-domain-containing protein [Viridothelium virens]|uniref:SCA7-domain-containing protein n=1 Tax=Viridothelium virens TaxID=1048519 RepID=A0A6A6GUD2_VIRVR|nr:SCA7-domain-containing protein [Viridothelium virens]
MASDTASRKTPATNGEAKQNSGWVTQAAIDEVFTEKEKKLTTIKIKKPGPKLVKPGNWKEPEFEGEEKRAEGSHDRSTSPLINPIPAEIAAAFPTGRPMEDKPDTVQCKHCKKPILRHAAAKHIQDCLAEKQKKARLKKERKEEKEKAQRKAEGKDDEKDDADGASTNGDKSKGARKSAVNGDGTAAKKTKKRKADGDLGEKAPKKKKKDEPKPKAPKTKGPVDVEKQCGVTLPNGAQCARSLTCKSHSMGAKRAVPGRSLPYDMLLQQYQKKNQAKQQTLVDANAPIIDDFEPSGPIDSDEERDAVLSAIARSRSRPLATAHHYSTKSRYQVIRMKEMLSGALGGRNGAGLFSVKSRGGETGDGGMGRGGDMQPLGSATLPGEGPFASPVLSVTPTVDAFGGNHERRASAAGPRGTPGLGSRHGSMSSTAGIP